MATFSTEELARKVLAMYVHGTTGQAGHILSRQDILAQWPKGFTPVELATALQYACSKGWLEQTKQGLKLTQFGCAEA